MNPYDEGFDAGFHDRAARCPYVDDTPESYDWWDGYDAGVEEAWAEEEEDSDGQND